VRAFQLDSTLEVLDYDRAIHQINIIDADTQSFGDPATQAEQNIYKQLVSQIISGTNQPVYIL
jgi:hypothetical protein